MKKILLPVVLILVVLGALAPAGFGFWADSRLNAMLEDLSTSGEVDFTMLKLNRGWFSSTAVISAELSGQSSKFMGNYNRYLEKAGKKPTDTPNVILRATIYHGPIAFMAGGAGYAPVVGLVKMDLRQSAQDDAKPLIDVPYTLQTRLELSGRNKILIDFPEYKGVKGRTNAEIVWQGLKAKISFASGLENAKVDLKAPSLKIEDKTSHFVMETLELKSNANKSVEGIALGSGHFRIGKIAFTDKRRNSGFQMHEAIMKADSSASGGNINSTLSTTIKEILGGGEKYGPAVITFSMKNLDAAAVGRINRQMKDMQKKNLPPDQASMMIGATVFSEIGNIMKKGPVFEISELSLKTSYGDVSGMASITVDTSRPELLSNPLLLKDAIIGKLKLQVPEDVLVAFQRIKLRAELGSVSIQYKDDQIDTIARNRVQKQMGALVAGNIFVKEGNMYKIEASFEKGTPVVNGQVFQIPMGGRPRR